MSAVEVVSRLGERALQGARRAGFFVANEVPQPIIQDLDGWLRTEAFVARYPYQRAADKILDRRISVFALRDGSAPALHAWNRDPLTGNLAPLCRGDSLDVHSRDVVGNIKYLWEPNRHLELVTLAQAFRLSGDERYLHDVRAYLDSWFHQCPYLLGPNWTSGLELAIRLINWSIAWQFVGAERSALFAGKDGERFLNRWLASIYQHVHFVRTHYSRYSSANNHLIGEAAGVFIATCTWPFWTDFEKWGQLAQHSLIEEMERQNFPDGVNKEQALAYQQFVLDFFLFSGLAGRARGREMPQAYWDRYYSMLAFIASVMDVAGNMPMIGDADDGYVTRLSSEEGFSPFKSLLATGSILFDEPAFAAKAGVLDDKTRFLVGDDGWEDQRRRSTLPRANGVTKRCFPEGGYYLLGDRLDTEGEVRLLVDAGPLGYLSIAAHGHADALSLWLSVKGREFLVDPGTYTYHGKPAWREYFRSTRAHNTVVVDETDQSEQGGNFMWIRHANATCLEYVSDHEKQRFVGEHDGYKRLKDPVRHRRVIEREGRKFTITDILDCRAAHTVERYWHFSEHCQVSLQGHVINAENNGVRIAIRCTETEIMEAFGDPERPAGWVSRRFDVKVPATSIVCRNRISGTAALKTVIDCD